MSSSCHANPLQEDVEDIQREVEVLNLISDHPNVAELVDSYEDPQHVHLVWLHTRNITAGLIVWLMAVHIMGVCKCSRRVATTNSLPALPESWVFQCSA